MASGAESRWQNREFGADLRIAFVRVLWSLVLDRWKVPRIDGAAPFSRKSSESGLGRRSWNIASKAPMSKRESACSLSGESETGEE